MRRILDTVAVCVIVMVVTVMVIMAVIVIVVVVVVVGHTALLPHILAPTASRRVLQRPMRRGASFGEVSCALRCTKFARR
jgi:hypothetical protein